MKIDKTFINMANENHTKCMEWEEVYEIGKQSVINAHILREELRIERRKQNIDDLIAGLGCLGIITLIFVISAIIVLVF